MSGSACPVCGTPTIPGARYCHACGALLERSPDPEAVAERRIVTVLFGDLSDFTAWAEDLDPERVGEVTDRVLAELARAVEEVGGHVDKLTGDGIMAVFGAPRAHEDDTERAVRAAAAMQVAVRRLVATEGGGGRRLGLRVGLNTGEVLAGLQARLAYTVVGDTVNTASRLADAARVGSVYAGRDTAQATTATASWRALPPLRLKGKRDPVAGYELVGLRPPGAVLLGVGEEAPLVGREAELGRMFGRLLDAVEGHRPATVIVTGDAGVGKTRLVAELGRFAGELPDARVLWGRCPPYGEGRELALLAAWVGGACAVDPGDGAGVVAERVRRTVHRLSGAGVGPPPAAVVDRLLALLGVAGVPLPRDSAAPGAAAPAGEPSLDAVVAVLNGLAAGGPLVLVADDLQWAAPEALDALARVASRLSGPCLLVGVGRGELLAEHGRWWQGLPQPEALPLEPLEAGAAERLLRAYVGGAELDPQAQSALLERAAGNPFFLGELLHLLVDRGLLVRRGARWQLVGPVPAEMLPVGVQAVLAARLDGLDAIGRSVVRDAAVVGTRFPKAALVALADGDAHRVEAGLRVLLARRMVVPRPGQEGYAFTHALVRDAAYAGLPKVERARRHAQVARWAAARPGDAVPDVDAFVAGHARRAGALAAEMGLAADDPAYAARSAGAAALEGMGRAALAREDNRAAEGLLTASLELDADGHAAPGRLVARAAARAALHRLGEAGEDLRVPLDAPDPVVRAEALVVQGQIRRRAGEDAAARQSLVSAFAAASELGVDRVSAEALRQLGLLDYYAGRLADAQQRFSAALELAERVGDVRGTGWALQHLAWNATTRGDYELAERTLARAADVFGELDDSGALSWCAGTEAFVRLLAGRLAEARDLARGLLPIGQAMGERWGVAACRTIDAFASAELGRLGTARRQGELARSAFAELGDSWGLAMALTASGAAERGARRLDEAAVLLEEAVRRSVRASHRATAALARTVLGYCALDAGDAAAAERIAGQVLAGLDGMGLRPGGLVGPRVLLGQAVRAQGRLAEALEHLAAAAATVDEPSLLFPRRQALAHYAGALLQAGRPAQALAAAESALGVPAEDVRSRVVALRALAACRAAVGERAAAREAAAEALALAGGTEQVGELEATRRVLAEIG